MGKSKNLKSYIQLLRKISIKTIYFNLKYFPLKQAIHFPVWISRKVYLRKVEGHVSIDCPLTSGMIRIGFADIGIIDESVSRIIWEVSGTIVFKGTAIIGHGSKICVGPQGTLILGNNFSFTGDSSIIAYSRIQFGNDCLVSWDVLIMDTDFHMIRNEAGEVVNANKSILIDEKVWIGCRCLILKGSTIPSNCVIGANSIVNHPLPKANGLYAGNPLRLIKEITNWEL